MSQLLFKRDWDNVKERFKKWWRRENTDRPVFYMKIMNQNAIDIYNNTRYLNNEERWTNYDLIMNREDEIMQNSIYPAEGIPLRSAYLGPGSLGVFLGAVPVFEADTIWYKPCFDDIRQADIDFNKVSKWWQWTVNYTKKLVERGKGKYIVQTPDLIENLDTIAAIVGTESCLYYLMDFPEEIHRLQKQILPVWFDAFEEIYQIVKDEEGGCSSFNHWAPGRYSKLQCDFSAMISPDMFAEFVMPYLKEQCNRLDYAAYHMDGPDAIKHLDMLLSIDTLDCIQWMPGAGVPDGSDPCWDMIYRKTLDAGKCIHAIISPEKIESFVKKFGSKAVFINTCPHDIKQAYDIINESYNW
jgi:hypothetical protein